MSATSSIFSGTSRYSSDFQQIIDRSVSIASLGLSQLESGKKALDEQSAALGSVESKVTALAGAVAGLETAAGAGSYALSNSDGTVAIASLSAGTLAGNYTLEVIGAGSYTSAMSADGLVQVTDPLSQNISAATGFTLKVGGVEYLIEPAAGTLAALAEAINARTDAGVEATIVNFGPPDTPDYRLSLESRKLGAVSVQLKQGNQDLLNTLSTGTLAEYRVNGQPAAAISSSSRTVTIAPGLMVTLLKAGTAKLGVTRSAAGVGNALSSVAVAYNAVVEEADKHRGKGAGALAGHSILLTLSETIKALTGYAGGPGTIDSLAALGLRFDDHGKLSLDADAFASAAAGGFRGIGDFLGHAETGGFLKYATGVLDGLENETSGVLRSAVQSAQSEVTSQDGRISEEQDRIDRLRESLVERMAASDALIASLERQVAYITNLFQSMKSVQESLR